MSSEIINRQHVRYDLYPNMVGTDTYESKPLIRPENIEVYSNEMHFSQYAKTWEVTPGIWVMSHSLNLKTGLIYGDARLETIANILKQGTDMENFITQSKNIFDQDTSEKLWETLVSGNFVHPETQTENVYQYHTPDLYEDKPHTRLLRVLLTDKCNLNCSYCKVMPFLNPAEKMHQPLSAVRSKDLDAVTDMFFEGSLAEEDKTIHVSGGEPLIAPNEVKHIYDRARSKSRPGERLRLVLGTNAILMTNEFAQYMADNNVFAIVSVDGRPETHNTYRVNHAGQDSFKKVDMGLQIIRAHKLHYGLSMVIGKHNHQTINEEIDWMLKQYPETVSLGVNKMKPPTPDQKHFDGLITPEQYVEAVYTAHQKFRDTGVYLELVNRHLGPFVEGTVRAHDCGAASGTTINIGPDGKIGTCKTAVATGWLSSSMENKEQMNSVMKALRSRSQLYKDECQKCPALGVCGNGCAYEAEVQHGDMNGIDEEGCGYTQLFLERFHKDLTDLLVDKISTNPFYVPNKEDREKLYGNVKPNELTLAGSIGHTNTISVNGKYVE